MIWRCIPWHGVKTHCKIDENIYTQKCINIIEYKSDKDIWCIISSDLNIIEILWHWIKQSFEIQSTCMNISHKVFQVFHDLWSNPSPKYIQNLYNSLPTPMTACLRVNVTLQNIQVKHLLLIMSITIEILRWIMRATMLDCKEYFLAWHCKNIIASDKKCICSFRWICNLIWFSLWIIDTVQYYTAGTDPSCR